MLRLLFNKRMRDIVALGALLVTARLLWGAGWPWWAWLPAAMLAGMVGAAAVILSFFVLQKCTYERDASRTKERLRRGEMEA
jgi:hypothetical protein